MVKAGLLESQSFRRTGLTIVIWRVVNVSPVAARFSRVEKMNEEPTFGPE